MQNNLISKNFNHSFLNSESLTEEREKAFLNLKTIGLPNKRVENWKYTDITSIKKG